MDRPISSGFGETNAREPSVTPASTKAATLNCPHCGKPLNRGLEQFLEKLGIGDEIINNVKNVDVEEYLNTAREYLRGSGDKAKTFAKENPGKAAAGVAVLAIVAGLLISALKRD